CFLLSRGQGVGGFLGLRQKGLPLSPQRPDELGRLHDLLLQEIDLLQVDDDLSPFHRHLRGFLLSHRVAGPLSLAPRSRPRSRTIESWAAWTSSAASVRSG